MYILLKQTKAFAQERLAIVPFKREAHNSDEESARFELLPVVNDDSEFGIDDDEVDLRTKEFDLLYYLVKHPKQVFTREQLLDSVWGYQFYGDERTVDVHIKRLRKKIGTDEQPFIHTVWGVGYKFDETAAENEG